jgi:hypothetical protein
MARQAAQEEYYDEEEQEAELATSRLVHPRSLGEYEVSLSIPDINR